MVGPTEQIRELKTQAKNRRDRGLAGYPRAVGLLRDAIGIANAALSEAKGDDRSTELATELADCYGIIGGIERRWASDGPGDERVAHLRESIRAYDAGYRLESNPQYRIVNSYNLLNRLIVRLLLRPELLDTTDAIDLGEGIERIDFRMALQQASDVIAEQLAGRRRGDYWALADLALVQLLLRRTDPATAYAPFNQLSPPAFAYSSVLAGLRTLADLPMSASGSIREASALLESRLQSLR
jgi:hypothetical protein